MLKLTKSRSCFWWMMPVFKYWLWTCLLWLLWQCNVQKYLFKVFGLLLFSHSNPLHLVLLLFISLKKICPKFLSDFLKADIWLGDVRVSHSAAVRRLTCQRCNGRGDSAYFVEPFKLLFICKWKRRPLIHFYKKRRHSSLQLDFFLKNARCKELLWPPGWYVLLKITTLALLALLACRDTECISEVES